MQKEIRALKDEIQTLRNLCRKNNIPIPSNMRTSEGAVQCV